MVQNITIDSTAILALKLAGFTAESIEKASEKTNKRRLKDFCGVSPKTICDVFEDIQDASLKGDRISNPNPAHLIYALYFLKKYPTAHEFVGRTCDGTEKTVLKRAWRYINALQALKEKKIQWIFGNGSNHNEFFVLSVDGVHFRVHEPRTQPSSGWYSKKFNKAGLTYEIGVAIYHDKIVWTNGPFPAGQNDMKVFRKPNGLMSKIPDGCLAIGDEGYRGQPKKVSTKNEYNSKELSAFKNRVRARHETVNSRLKAFGILNQVFRTKGKARMSKHKAAFEACSVLVQYEFDNGSPLFKV